MTSVHFVANIEGNFGASLNDSWATGTAGWTEGDGDEDTQFSDHPLATGLLLGATSSSGVDEHKADDDAEDPV